MKNLKFRGEIILYVAATRSKWLTLLLSLAFLGLVAGCGGQIPQETTANAPISHDERGYDINWPTRPVTIVVPLPPGGDTDFFARAYAPFLTEHFGVDFEVVNVVGDGGIYGAVNVHQSNPDGYTILFHHTGMFTNMLLGATTLRHTDFAIACITNFESTNILVANPQAEFTDAFDFLERARENPWHYRVAATTTGFSVFPVRAMEVAGDFYLTPVDMAGGQMAEALVNGEVDLAIGAYGVFRPFIERGEIVPLILSAERRNPDFRHVATVEDLGFSDAAIGRAYFFAFPPGTDDALLHRLSDAVAEIQFNDEYISAIRDFFSVQPFFLPTPAVHGFLQELWNDMYRMAAYLDR